MTEEELVKSAQKMLRDEKVDYTNDAIYGAAIMMDSYLNDDLTLEEALNEFIENSNVELQVKH